MSFFHEHDKDLRGQDKAQAALEEAYKKKVQVFDVLRMNNEPLYRCAFTVFEAYYKEILKPRKSAIKLTERRSYTYIKHPSATHASGEARFIFSQSVIKEDFAFSNWDHSLNQPINVVADGKNIDYVTNTDSFTPSHLIGLRTTLVPPYDREAEKYLEQLSLSISVAVWYSNDFDLNRMVTGELEGMGYQTNTWNTFNRNALSVYLNLDMQSTPDDVQKQLVEIMPHLSDLVLDN